MASALLAFRKDDDFWKPVAGESGLGPKKLISLRLGVRLLGIQVFARPSTAIPVGPLIPAEATVKGQLPPAGLQVAAPAAPLRASWIIAPLSTAEMNTSLLWSRLIPYELPREAE